MTRIARVYDDSKNATDAVNELKNSGIADVAVVSTPRNRTDSPASAEDIVTSIEKAGVQSAYADSYAERIKRGGAVVIVNAPFGTAKKAAAILNRHGPGQTSTVVQAKNPGERGATESDATAAPLSTAFNVPLLTESSTSSPKVGSKTLSSLLGIPELVSSNKFFSGFPLLTQNQKPFSSLARNQAPFSSLTRNQKPFSSLAVNQKPSASLLHDPAPLSTWLGLPVLIKGRHRIDEQESGTSQPVMDSPATGEVA